MPSRSPSCPRGPVSPCSPARPRRPILLAACAALALALAGCQSDDGTSRETVRGRSRPAGATTDTGSRYLDAGGPIGGLTVETPPVAGRYVSAP